MYSSDKQRGPCDLIVLPALRHRTTCSMRSGKASTFPTVLSPALVPGGIRRWTVTDLLKKRVMVKDEAVRLGAQHRSTLFPWYLNVVPEWTGNGLPLNAHSGHGTVQNRSASVCDTAQAWRWPYLQSAMPLTFSHSGHPVKELRAVHHPPPQLVSLWVWIRHLWVWIRHPRGGSRGWGSW